MYYEYGAAMVIALESIAVPYRGFIECAAIDREGMLFCSLIESFIKINMSFTITSQDIGKGQRVAFFGPWSGHLDTVVYWANKNDNSNHARITLIRVGTERRN